MFLAQHCQLISDLNHVWFGVTAENQKCADERIPILLDIPVKNKWVSVEPILEEINLKPYLPKLDWVVCGGETGAGARFTDPDWIAQLYFQCETPIYETPFFFKKWGSKTCKNTIELCEYDWLEKTRQYPPDLTI